MSFLRAHPMIFSPSALMLIGANMVPLYGVLAGGWSILDVMLLFWLENVMIGVMNVVRMGSVLVLRRALSVLPLIPFFIVHYGMFAMGHGFFVLMMFGPDHVGDRGMMEIEELLDVALFSTGLAIPALILFCSHVFSLILNFFIRGEYKHVVPDHLMFEPYGRVVVLHITVIIGGMAVMQTGAGLWALILLVALKSGIDLAAHVSRHEKMQTRKNTATAEA